MLELRNVRVSYGAAPAVSDVSLDVAAGALVVVVGPNGAGKTTLINAIAGVHRIDTGELSMDGRSLRQVAPYRFCEHGIALVPEGRRLFTTLSVRENLELGSYRGAARARRAQSLAEICTLFPVLEAKLEAPAGTLSGGQQQMLAIGRALMSRPQLLLLDEPSMGLAPLLVDQIMDAVVALRRDAGTTVLLVEQNAVAALSIADRGYVIETGRMGHAGTGAELLRDPAVREAYLGL
ncbi:MAG TPA: ABC transporter ATP-binding protein [Burkholderiales bacterium]|nr:ABC transporter ATP-binding protein [Burkholderiales bacterium]